MDPIPSRLRSQPFDAPIPLLIALVTVCAAAAAFLNLPAAVRVPLGIALVLVVPGWILATSLLGRTSATHEEAGMLIPPFSFVLTAFARLAAGGLGITGDRFVGTWAALCLIAWLWSRQSRGTSDGMRKPVWSGRPDSTAWWVAAGLAALVVLPSVVNVSIRYWGDAPFHGGLVNEILMRGIPPENPGFVGMPASYMWIYHVGIVALVDATGADAYSLFFWVNGLMMFALSLAVYRLATMCWPRISDHRLAPVVVVLGMNALGWLTAIAYGVVASLTGEVRGFSEIREVFTQLLGHPSAQSVNDTLISRAPFILSSFIYKYLCPTTLAACLTMIAASVSMAAAFLREGNARRLVVLGLLIFCANVVHPIMGLPACVALVCGALPGAVASPLRRRSVHVALAVAAGCVLSGLPIYYMLGASIGAGERTRMDFLDGNVPALVQGLLVVALPAWFGLRALRKSGNPLAGFLLGVGVAFLAMAMTVDYPYVGETYLVYLAYFGVATLAVGGVGNALSGGRLRRARGWRWALVALVFLPTPLIQVQAHARHNDPSSTWYPNDPDEIAVFDFVRDHTATGTVVLDSQLAYSPAASCYAGRRGYFGGLYNAKMLGYPSGEMERRERICRNIFSEPDISDETIQALNALDIPVCVIARRGSVDRSDWQQAAGALQDSVSKLNRLPALFRPILSTPTIVLYEYCPSENLEQRRLATHA